MTKTIKHLARKLRVAHVTTNLCYALLLGLLTAWSFVRAPSFSPIYWVILCLPLLILWPGMRKKRHRTYSWLCFVILVYFIKAVEGSLSSIASWFDFSLLILSVVIFVGAMLTSRWLQYAQLPQNNTLTNTTFTDKDLP